MRRDSYVEAKAADFTLTAEDSGKTFIITAADVTATLPSVETGLTYTFVVETVSGGGGTGFSISPAAADNINRGTNDKDLINSTASDVIGDACTIVGDVAGEGWLTVSQIGTWAAEG